MPNLQRRRYHPSRVRDAAVSLLPGMRRIG